MDWVLRCNEVLFDFQIWCYFNCVEIHFYNFNLLTFYSILNHYYIKWPYFWKMSCWQKNRSVYDLNFFWTQTITKFHVGNTIFYNIDISVFFNINSFPHRMVLHLKKLGEKYSYWIQGIVLVLFWWLCEKDA